MRTFALALICISAACGTDGGTNPPTPDAPGGGSGSGSWTPLIEKSWTLPPGGENTSDLQLLTLDKTITVGGIRPIDPPGTHHTLLFKGVSGVNAIFASGVGTNALEFPAGKAMKLEAGMTIGLQLHVFNTSDQPLTGRSGIEILEVDPTTVTDEVDMFLPGPKNLSIAPMQTSTKSGTCTVKSAQTLIALFPHMHQLGSHFKTTIHTAAGDRVIHDGAYSFEHQAVIPLDSIKLAVGDTITTECTWTNNTTATVTYGESSTTEMCYSILYRYPRGTEEFCTQ